MSAEALLLIIAGAIFSLVTTLFGAWFSHRLSANEAAAFQRSRDIREDSREIRAALAAQSETIGQAGQLLAVLHSQVISLPDRMLIIESGQATLNTANQLMRQELDAHIQWTREQFRLATRAG